MTDEWSVPAWAVVAGLAALVVLLGAVVLAVAGARRRDRRRAAQADAELASLRAQVLAIEERLAAAAPRVAVDEHEYTITTMGELEAAAAESADGADRAPARVVPGPLFADLVLRESVVQAAALAAGLRRALAPETRNRIRFEMRREVKRARKQRRADLREARRQYEARQRAGLPEESAA